MINKTQIEYTKRLHNMLHYRKIDRKCISFSGMLNFLVHAFSLSQLLGNVCASCSYSYLYLGIASISASLPIFATAFNVDEEISLNEGSKIALQARNRRRKLFKSALDEHYQQFINDDDIRNSNGNTNSNRNSNNNNGETRASMNMGEPCIYYSVGHQRGAALVMSSPWTIEFCQGQSLSKLKLIPLDGKNETAGVVDSPMITIESKKYIVSEIRSIGVYLDPSVMTKDEYDDEIYKIWGNISKEGDNEASSSDSYYIKGDEDECKSFISNVQMKRASKVHDIERCCPGRGMIAYENYFTKQSTKDGQEILKIDETSKCRYSVLLCNTCARNKNGIKDVEDELEKQPSQSVLDIFSHLPDKDSAEKASSSSNSINKSYYEEIQDILPKSFPPMPPSRVKSNIELLKSMFRHAYDSYMYNAYPASEIKPKSCGAGSFNLVRLPALTLIDSLDTLLIMGNHTEFARSVERLRVLDTEMKANPIWKNSNKVGGLFAVNQNVSVFETNIRVLGGLLSAHQMAEAWVENKVLIKDVFSKDGDDVLIGEIEAREEMLSSSSNAQFDGDENEDDIDNQDLDACPEPASKSFVKEQTCSESCKESNNTSEETTNNSKSLLTYWAYDGVLLSLANDIGQRLLPAFQSKTGIPYGTVNLLYGIPNGETPIASLAGAGSLSLEMELLSRLTGNDSFGKAAKLASRALWLRRFPETSLLGKHINVQSGKWTETLSGIGSNSDSFYEYLLKHYILFPEDSDFFDMFENTYAGIFNNARQGDWYPDVEMSHLLRTPVFESLAAFYPGLQVLVGELNPSSRSENSFINAKEYLGFLPERFDYSQWREMSGHANHPLRPEIHESCYFLHMATKNIEANSVGQLTNSTSSWLWSADFSIHQLEKLTKTTCGYGVIKYVSPETASASLGKGLHVENMLQDEMPSFFLSETLKYLYLAFDASNPLNIDKERDWIFTTEAHPIHYAPLLKIENEELTQSKLRSNNDAKEKIIKKLRGKSSFLPNKAKVDPDQIRLQSENWTKLSTKQQYLRDLKGDSIGQVKVGVNDKQFFEIFGRVMTNETASTANGNSDLNFATMDHNRNGRGAHLAKSCPNYHNPNSLWLHALAGDQISYTDLFVTSIYELSDDPFVKRASEKVMPALTASALFGLSYMSNRASICPFTERDGSNKKEKYSHSTNKPPLGTQRVDMGEGLGSFDISVYNNEGFYIKQVHSGESVEATIINKPIDDQQSAPLIAIESFIPVQAKKKPKGMLLKSLGSSFSMLKSVFVRKKDVVVSPTKDVQKYDRSVIISDMLGNAFTCKVELIHATGEAKRKDNQSSERSAFKQHNVIGVFPCLSATYGPTELSTLHESNGTSFEAVLHAPNNVDRFGCQSRLVGEYSHEPRIELVERGICNFRMKALNIGERNVVKAVIIINTQGDKLFVMAGPEEKGQDYSNEPASVLVSKEDGYEILHAIDSQKKSSGKKSQIYARISLIPQNPDTDDIQTWPHVTSSPDSVQILASQGWGVTAKKDNGNWSIFILHHDAGQTDNPESV